MINAIQNRMSNAMPDSSMPPLLSESANYKDAAATHAVLIESRKKYIESLGKLISEIKSWRGNDSVTAMYTSGRLLIGRITKIQDDSRGDSKDWVTFKYLYNWDPGDEIDSI